MKLKFCILCGDSSQDYLCEFCQSELPWNNHCCEICALPLPTTKNICGQCLQHRPHYHKNISAFTYTDPIDYLISHFKFNHNLALGKILSHLLLKKLQHYYIEHKKPELIIPVPLHRKRLIERGYNQAVELARPIAKKLKIPISKNAVKRIKNTAKQSELHLKKRKKNMRNAFELTKPLTHYQHIAIIDDVVTTGQTIQSLCKCIQSKQQLKIDIWCIARTDV